MRCARSSCSEGLPCALCRQQPPCALRPLGMPVFYRNVTLTIPPSDDGSPERVRKYDKVTRKTLQKVLDNEGCDVVKDPISKDWVDFELLALQDESDPFVHGCRCSLCCKQLTTQRASTPVDKRVRLINFKWRQGCTLYALSKQWPCQSCHPIKYGLAFIVAQDKLLLKTIASCACACCQYVG